VPIGRRIARFVGAPKSQLDQFGFDLSPLFFSHFARAPFFAAFFVVSCFDALRAGFADTPVFFADFPPDFFALLPPGASSLASMAA
jgi:hypothetical protein